MDKSRDSGSGGTGMDPASRLALLSLPVKLSLVGIKPRSLALRADVLTESVVFAALARHDRQKSLFDF